MGFHWALLEVEVLGKLSAAAGLAVFFRRCALSARDQRSALAPIRAPVFWLWAPGFVFANAPASIADICRQVQV